MGHRIRRWRIFYTPTSTSITPRSNLGILPPRSHPVLAILGISVRSCAPLGPPCPAGPALARSLGVGLSVIATPQISPSPCERRSPFRPLSRVLVSQVPHCLSQSDTRSRNFPHVSGAGSDICCPILKRYFEFCTPYSISSASLLLLPRADPPFRDCGAMPGECEDNAIQLRSTLFRNIAN